MTYHAKVISGGKMVIPADLRREFGIKDGDTLIVEHGLNGGLVIKTHAQIVREVQAEIAALATLKSGNAVDELLAERRAEAAAEDAAEEEARRRSAA